MIDLLRRRNQKVVWKKDEEMKKVRTKRANNEEGWWEREKKARISPKKLRELGKERLERTMSKKERLVKEELNQRESKMEERIRLIKMEAERKRLKEERAWDREIIIWVRMLLKPKVKIAAEVRFIWAIEERAMLILVRRWKKKGKIGRRRPNNANDKMKEWMSR